MRTYQELVNTNGDEKLKMEFVRAVVVEHRNSAAYKIAKDAEAYYARHNVTMEKYEKVIRTASGATVKDVWSSNYKLTHGFFRRFVLQQTMYILANGITFEDGALKDKLGKTFDNAVQTMAKKAMVDGVSFGFWNLDHLQVFSFVDTDKEPGFAPVVDAETGEIKAGVRYWSPSDKTNRWTLYELDGYTEYIQREGKDVEVLRPMQPYKKTVLMTDAGGVEDVVGDNYKSFPIIPMYANDLKQSELVGIRSAIDCYDFIKSGMANNVDETSVFYWVLKGTGGMDEPDLVRFVNRMKQLHAQVLPEGAEAEANTLNVPVDANEKLLDRLKVDLYDDFMLMNPERIMNGNMTATAIRTAYQQQDDKCGDFEMCVRNFVDKLLELVGIDSDYNFTWNRIANMTEETQMVMTASPVLDREAILKHLTWLTPEEVDDILKRTAAEEIQTPNEVE